MSNLDNNEQDDSKLWLRYLKSAAGELRKTGNPAPNAQALARKADAISEQLQLIARIFEADNPDGVAQLCTRAAHEARGPGQDLSQHLEDDMQDRLKQHATSLKALAKGFHENADLLRTLAAQPDRKNELEKNATFWVKEIQPAEATITASFRTLCDLSVAMEQAVQSHFADDTPEKQQKSEEMVQAVIEGGPIDPDELRGYVRKATRRYRMSAFNQLEETIQNAMVDYGVLKDELHPERIAGDLSLAVAHHLLDTSAEKLRRR